MSPWQDQTQIHQTETALPLIQSSVSVSFIPPQFKLLILCICIDENTSPDASNLMNSFGPELLPSCLIRGFYTFQQGPLLSKCITLCLSSPSSCPLLNNSIYSWPQHSFSRPEICADGASYDGVILKNFQLFSSFIH